MGDPPVNHAQDARAMFKLTDPLRNGLSATTQLFRGDKIIGRRLR